MPNFAQRVEIAVDALGASPQRDVDENEFIDASRLVYDGVREIRRAVLMNRVRFTPQRFNFIMCLFNVLIRVSVFYAFFHERSACFLLNALSVKVPLVSISII